MAPLAPIDRFDHYNYFRDYDPGLGRYVQSDPIGVAPLRDNGAPLLNHLYGYVDGSPLLNVDPLGLLGESPGGGGNGGFGGSSCEACDCWVKCMSDDPLLPDLLLGLGVPLVNLKTPNEHRAGSSRWTSVDRRMPKWTGANPNGGATVSRGAIARVKCVGRFGTAAAGVGAFTAGYGLGASARCLFECKK
jgi:RHS repeat-associated protein